MEKNKTNSSGAAHSYHSSVVYPIKSTRRLNDLETWSHHSITRFLGRLTVYNFPAPPERILDLGCGIGTWVIDAAREFRNSTIVGFELEHNQPPLENTEFCDVIPRVKWVHGNLWA
jgi:cyclopropane fatty-acyl-phospholipid synthase-like methyltransferase